MPCCLDCKRNTNCPKYPRGNWNDTEVHEKGCEYFKEKRYKTSYP